MNTRIALTGGTGYIGSTLVRFLVERGFTVHVICRPSSDVSRLVDLSKEIFISVYSGEYFELVNLLNRAKPHCVIHTAAEKRYSQTGVPTSPSGFIDAHIVFPSHLLQAMTQCKIRYFINTESYWQYGESLDNYAANSMYAATKSGFKEILAYYSKCRGIDSISLVLGDTYGPGDRREKVLNLLKNSLESEEPLDLTEGHQLLSFAHIEDVTAAYLHAFKLLCESGHTGLATYSVGLGYPRTLRDIVEIAEKLLDKKFRINWGHKPYRDTDLGPIPEGESLPGWRPKISLSRGLLEFFNSN